MNYWINTIFAQVKNVGNHTKNKSDSSIANFTILKKFDIQIHLRSPLKTNGVLWHPIPNGWIKCNIDGLSRGKPMVSACGGIFRNDHVLHVGSFCCSLGYRTALLVEFGAALFSLEKANERHWNHIFGSNQTPPWWFKIFQTIVWFLGDSKLYRWIALFSLKILILWFPTFIGKAVLVSITLQILVLLLTPSLSLILFTAR